MKSSKELNANVYLNTPLLESPRLNEKLGKRVWFKMDCHQPTRSFKIRGMAQLVAEYGRQGRRSFVASSGGNAGYSLAFACRKAGAQLMVVVPESATSHMRKLIQSEGAIVVIEGESWQEADGKARKIADETGAVYVSPFNDPILWRGHATLIDECAQDMPEPDMVVLAVGGGGLLCGVMEGMERNGWSNAKVLAAETYGASSYAAAMQAGEIVTLPSIDTIATSLGAKSAAQQALDWSRKRQVISHVCEDSDTIRACKAFGEDFNVLVEPACGAALSAVYLPTSIVEQAATILVVVCGGAGITPEQFCQYLKMLG